MRKLTLLLAMGLFSVASSASLVAANAQPNVLIVFVDDFGPGDVSCYGGKQIQTPAIDRLASEGLRFSQFYVASPICSSSRCGLITGQFPARWKITSYLQSKAGNRECEQADFLDPTAPSMVRAFHNAGYATAHVGKWHLGGGRDVTDAPKFTAYGYDIGLGTYESPEPAAGLGLKSVPWDTKIEPQQVPRHDRTRWMVDEALSFARQHPEQPWFVNLWLDDTHTPFRPSDDQKTDDTGGPGTVEYRAVLKETDHQIGRLLNGLQELKVDQNTIVILAGDNGPQPSFDRARTNGLRGMKWSLYEGGIQTPFIIRWPGHVPAGVTNKTTVLTAVDIFPTLCALTGVDPPAGVGFDGEDLSSSLNGREHKRSRMIFWEYGRKPAPSDQKGLRAFPYPNEPNSKSPNVAVRDGDWKLLVNADSSSVELYNLHDDPMESYNVAADHLEVTDRLKNAALKWRQSLP
jgi:arylsulfatase A-like enzyme